MDVLRKVTKLNRVNGRRFAVTDRTEAIQELLAPSEYWLLNQCEVIYLCVLCPLHELNSPVWIAISHIDCISTIKECFLKEPSNGLMRGTFDNMLNTIISQLFQSISST